MPLKGKLKQAEHNAKKMLKPTTDALKVAVNAALISMIPGLKR